MMLLKILVFLFIVFYMSTGLGILVSRVKLADSGIKGDDRFWTWQAVYFFIGCAMFLIGLSFQYCAKKVLDSTAITIALLIGLGLGFVVAQAIYKETK